MVSGPFGSGAFGTGTFSSSPLYSTKDLIDSVLRNTNHSNPSTETNKRAVVLSMLNNRYARVTTSRHWDWLLASQDFTLDGPYEAGTVSVTQGSSQVTGTGTGWSSNAVPNNKLIIKDEVYLIGDVASGTELSLDGNFVGTTATGESYKVVKPIYVLPATCEHVRSLSVDGVGELVPVGVQELRRLQQYEPTLVGPPRYFAEVYRRAQDGVRHIEVFPAPDKKYQAHIDMNVNIMALEDNEDNFPLIPDRHRVVLYYGALAEFWEFLHRQDLAVAAEARFQQALMAMQNDHQLTDSKIILQPARNYRVRVRRRGMPVSYGNRGDFGRHE